MGLPVENNELVRYSTFNNLVDRLDLLLSAGAASGSAQELWLDPTNGDDISADGTKMRPYKTWAALRASGRIPRVIPSVGVKVYIKEGIIRESLNITQYMTIGLLTFEAVPNGPSPFPTTPLPWGLFFPFLRGVVGATGPMSGTATGGTKTRINLAGAGWVPGQLRGKFLLVTDGTNMFTFARVFDNGADYLEVTGYYSAPFDATTVFSLAEEPVTIRPVDTAYGQPLSLFMNGGGGSIQFSGIRFEIQNRVTSNYNAYLYYNSCRVQFEMCALIGNASAMPAGGGSQVNINVGVNPGEISADSCDFWIPPTIAGANKWTGAIWAFGPHGPLSLSSCAFNDAIESYYGCLGVEISGCGQRYRTNMPEQNLLRGVVHFRYYSNWLDAASRNNLWRFDGPVGMDCRDSIMENAPGDGIVTYSHHADGAHVMLMRTEVNGCGGAGVHVKGNSVVMMSDAKTDPAKLNGTWGVRVGSGSQILYAGVNTIKGVSGDINLGDGVTAVAHGVAATDATHLTRVSSV
jgi:hypothetical protein